MGISNGCINSVEFWKSNMAFFPSGNVCRPCSLEKLFRCMLYLKILLWISQFIWALRVYIHVC